VAYAVIAGLVVYGILRAMVGLRMSDEDQRIGADLSIHKIGANPESDMMR
jgi:Amt family ammonium transporter